MRSQPMIVLTLMVLMGGSAAALGGGVPADSGADCAEWNTEDFFKKASVEEVAACLESGADPSDRDVKGRIPLHLAATYTQHPGVIDALIKAGGDPKKRDWSPVLNPMTLSMVVPAIVVYIVN